MLAIKIIITIFVFLFTITAYFRAHASIVILSRVAVAAADEDRENTFKDLEDMEKETARNWDRVILWIGLLIYCLGWTVGIFF
jgi:hypothetical protein